MAEVEFGDSELFEQLDGDLTTQPVHLRFEAAEDCEEESGGIREQLARCEETINQLRADNDELRRKLSILSRPSGLDVDDKLDGPLLQILFMNHVISKQYHQEVEDFVTSLVQKYEESQKSNPEKTSFNIKPQPSSILLEESGCSNGSTIKKIKDAFSVVGNVLYFTHFCLDKLGQPLLNENPQLTDGWEIPKYQQVFTQIVSLDGQEIQVKAKRPKPCCFNCGSEEHQMKDCQKPRNQAHINMKRKEFMDACGEAGNQNYQQRYHAEEVEERFNRFKPGLISEELREALGMSDSCLPPFIYRMRHLGYPPGWLKESELENSGLSLYDGKESSDGDLEEGEMHSNVKHVSYDVSKLVSYPGFNTLVPDWMTDDWRSYGSIPMQANHQREAFASYLTNNYPTHSPNTSIKRSASPSASFNRKKQKTYGNQRESPVDMDMESDMDTVLSSPSSGSFKFQPPLPPGSPLYGTPPPLPRGTPPSTPTNFIPPPPPTPTPPPLPKGTPPPTPKRGSPMPHGKDSLNVKPQVVDSMDEDALTLEELEEQQRLIWAALENAESTNSDSDAPTPLTVTSVTSSPSRTDVDNVTEMKPAIHNPGSVSNNSDAFLDAIATEPDDDISVLPEEDEPLKENHVDCTVVEGNGSAINAAEEKTEVNDDAPEESACEVPSVTNSGKPDMSKFAAGITPFEYDNMSESTGTYLRLRNVLKNSPRNQQKGKPL
ncbi:zinc finger CCHC domain-containing 8 [Pelobates cultripes]|uniref:Zinc finger CCHC domain-containing protein 8 n=1 Tax=Pelobates cultripes TaxID=61616 RepID=A0AAD1S9M8_PELCU|nr:zinc finger CCHC domain-containing 8 [Pelobates cultripes]